MNWQVYILLCKDNSYYTGITTDLARRVDEHNEDDRKAARYTRARRPVKLVYQESFSDRSSASKRESEIKKLTRTDKVALVQSSSV